MVELEIISSADKRHITDAHNGLTKIIDTMQRVPRVWIVFCTIGVELIKVLRADNILPDSVLIFGEFARVV